MLKRASRKSDAGNTSAHASNPSKWDIAIAVRPGLHVTVFTSGMLLVLVAAMLIVAALVAVIWFL